MAADPTRRRATRDLPGAHARVDALRSADDRHLPADAAPTDGGPDWGPFSHRSGGGEPTPWTPPGGQADRTPTGGWVPDRKPRRVRGGRAARRTRRHAATPGAGADDAPGGDVPGDHDPGPDATVRDGCDADDAEDMPDIGTSTGRVTTPGDSAGDDDLADPSDDDDAGWAARLRRRGPWGALAEQWIPESLQHARVNPGRRGAALLSVIAAMAAVIAAVGVWWDRPDAVPVAPRPGSANALTVPATAAGGMATRAEATEDAPDAAAATGPGESAAPDDARDADRNPAAPSTDADPSRDGRSSGAADGTIVVSVTGNVRHPGLVTVPADARVADAITAAGGARDPADLTGLNLAAHLADGDSVVIRGGNRNTVASGSTLQPADAADATTGEGADAGSDTAPIDINSADATELESLPGIGPVTAGSIVTWRREHGPFTAVEQLQAVSGIGPATFARIAAHVTV